MMCCDIGIQSCLVIADKFPIMTVSKTGLCFRSFRSQVFPIEAS